MQALLEDVMETTEVHWSTGTILAVFFAASLISAVFFGLGYSFGRGGTTKPALGMAITSTGSVQDKADNPTSVSDSAQQPSSHAALRYKATAAAIGAQETAVAYRASDNPQSAQVVSRQVSSMPTRHAAAAFTKAAKHVGHTKAVTSEVGATHYMVQVGAIGDRRDARLLVSKLRKKGFHAGIYRGKHDKYLHVQIGPYATVQQAQTVRHRVTASGYHAILKHAS
jgi:cell division septation protein DedD